MSQTTVIRYERPYYLAKITELEGYHAQLTTHHTRMKELQGQMFQFWDDDLARRAASLLVDELTKVETAMKDITLTLNTYKTIISEYDAKIGNADADFDKLVDLLNAVGSFV